MKSLSSNRVPGPIINEYPPFDLKAWIRSFGRFNPLTVIAAPGTGKSRFLGRILVWHDLVTGRPQAVIDPMKGTIVNVIDKCNDWAQDFERRFWETYKQPLTPGWIRFVEWQLHELVSRLVYVDMNGHGSFPFYYRLNGDEELFESSQRIVEVFRRMDPALETASIEGFNALYRIAMYAGMILVALGLQITEAEDLVRRPEQWSQRFDQAIASYPQVRPAVQFFREFGTLRPDVRSRLAGSFLTKILAFSADPTLAAMVGTNNRTLNLQDVIDRKQTILLDFSSVHNAERRRLLLLWVCSELFLFAKSRGTAGRQTPFSIVIDEITQLLGYQQNGQSIIAVDYEEWVSVIARNRGVWLTSALQSLSQVGKQMGNALLQGNQIIGAIPNPEDARRIAEYHFQWDPYSVKKKTPVWMGIASKPFYDPVPYQYRGTTFYMAHVSTETTPTVIDYTTEEFSIDEQLQLLTQEIQHLPRFHFLVRASGIEGQIAAPLRMLDISNVDAGIYPDEERVAEACRRLTARSGFSPERALAEIQKRASKSHHKKRVKTTNGDARLNSTPNAPADDLPAQSDSAITHPAPVIIGGADEDPWQE